MVLRVRCTGVDLCVGRVRLFDHSGRLIGRSARLSLRPNRMKRLVLELGSPARRDLTAGRAIQARAQFDAFGEPVKTKLGALTLHPR